MNEETRSQKQRSTDGSKVRVTKAASTLNKIYVICKKKLESKISEARMTARCFDGRHRTEAALTLTRKPYKRYPL